MPSRGEKRGSWNPRTRICIQRCCGKGDRSESQFVTGKTPQVHGGSDGWWRRAAIVGRKTIHRVAKNETSPHHKCRGCEIGKSTLQESKDKRNKRSKAEGSGSEANSRPRPHRQADPSALQRDASVSNVALAHKVNQLGLIKDIVALLDPRQRELQSAPRGATAAPAGRAPGALVHGAEAGAVDNAVPGLTRVTRQACACPWANPCPAGSR